MPSSVNRAVNSWPVWRSQTGEVRQSPSILIPNPVSALGVLRVLFLQLFLLIEHRHSGDLVRPLKMADWNSDEYMSQWDRKYVSNNVKKGSKPYEKGFFLGLNSDLARAQPNLQVISPAIIVRRASMRKHRLL